MFLEGKESLAFIMLVVMLSKARIHSLQSVNLASPSEEEKFRYRTKC
jgi:hypothetical protein